MRSAAWRAGTATTQSLWLGTWLFGEERPRAMLFLHACRMGLEAERAVSVRPVAGLDQGEEPDSPAMVRHREDRW
jgi:hypothetical protein